MLCDEGSNLILFPTGQLNLFPAVARRPCPTERMRREEREREGSPGGQSENSQDSHANRPICTRHRCTFLSSGGCTLTEDHAYATTAARKEVGDKKRSLDCV